ncbi:MAG: IS200/IS605 family transposase [Calditrichia bacterium]|nr:IS200/IS605 family transposase [Calditrichia bacterium]
MSHSLTKIWIHGIFSTKNKTQLIDSDYEPKLYSYIKNKFENDLKCNLKKINGTADHIHILFLLNSNVSINQIFHDIKGASSHWVNQNDFINQKFAWQIGYAAYSVSESQLSKVEKYIHNQKEHHKKITFEEEYHNFMQKYGFENKNRKNS